MKVLYIYSDEEYAVLNLKDTKYGQLSYKELWDITYNEPDHILEVIHNEDKIESYYKEPIYVRAVMYNINMNEDTTKFINTINEFKDYDSTKHDDWFVIYD